MIASKVNYALILLNAKLWHKIVRMTQNDIKKLDIQPWTLLTSGTEPGQAIQEEKKIQKFPCSPTLFQFTSNTSRQIHRSWSR